MITGVVLPADLRDQFHDPEFWTAFFMQGDEDPWGDDRWEQAGQFTADFPVGGGHAVRLDIRMDLTSFELELLSPGNDVPSSLGWDDDAQWHPHVFRWEELDLVCRAVALTEPSLRHPGPALALLWRFAVIGEHDDLDRITPLVDAAFVALRPDAQAGNGWWPRVWNTFGNQDLRDASVVWQRDAQGNWSVTQDESLDRPGPDLYSLRWTPDEPGDESSFPFTAWRALLDQARRTLDNAVDTRWLADPAVTEVVARIHEERDLALAPELGRALAGAGCDVPAILSGLSEPVHPAETCWLLELITSAPHGSLVKKFLEPVPVVPLG
jgi:hypothetical protein